MYTLIQASYFASAILFILGLKKMSSPVTARTGIMWAGVGMVAATIATFGYPGLNNFGLMISAIVIGSLIAWYAGRVVTMTAMPQMVAIYNGMGGGAAGAIGAVELIRAYGIGSDSVHALPPTAVALALLGALIGSVSFTGSIVAFAKLQGLIRTTLRIPGGQAINLIVFIFALAMGLWALNQGGAMQLGLFFAAALLFGLLMTLPIGGADMPVVISLFNALTGLAVGIEGFVLQNPALIIAGTVVGAAGTLLTQLMAKAMNRSLANVLFKSFGAHEAKASEIAGEQKPIEAQDAAIMLAYADKVIIIPGYGLAVAQAQHKVWELAKLLKDRGVAVKFAIHPVAGRMPGHMNVLLAEAGVSYDLIADMEEINPEFENTDVSVVIGANDVVNPAARTETSSPIYGMPILNVDRSKNVIVIKRGQGKGFSGVENALFYGDHTRMLYGDGQQMAASLITNIKELG
ncbi:MAG: NAD(P)(+) transhydrogenase (Re/Si-specific) subunit beta [Gammaproteobacteria bacterium]|nr:MAG: NAD(P)(+) transhydrogenase (Re/Si-specific) subunit beta [Gammaproteobacteria bacterium]